MNTVYLLKNDKSLYNLGTINDDTNEIRINLNLVQSVNYFNEQIFTYIKNDSGNKSNVLYFVESEDIKGMIFHIIRWRRCTAFLVIQKSALGVRYLCYMYDKIKHSANSFGTTCEMAANDIDKIKKEFLDNKNYMLDNLKNNIYLHTFKDSIDHMDDNINHSFGI